MLIPTLLTSLLYLSTTTSAAPTTKPTRTNCRCELVQDNTNNAADLIPTPATYTPAAAHWTPPIPSESPIAKVNDDDDDDMDVCSSLGAELEDIEFSDPERYHAFVSHSKKPLPTTVLLASSSNMPTPPTMRKGRVVCHSVPKSAESGSGAAKSNTNNNNNFNSSSNSNDDSFLSLWAMQMIVAVVIFACAAEGLHLGMQWIQQRSAHHDAEQGEDSGLRLSGEEKTLLAVPLTNSGDSMYSPGVQKKLRAYETAKYFVSEGSNGKREFVAYESEDDDEVNRPVM